MKITYKCGNCNTEWESDNYQCNCPKCGKLATSGKSELIEFKHSPMKFLGEIIWK